MHLGQIATLIFFGVFGAENAFARITPVITGSNSKHHPQLATPTFPTAKELVQSEIDRILESRSQRQSIGVAISRLEKLELLQKQVARAGLPPQALAIGIVESGFYNFTEAESSGRAAGFWQIERATAVGLGLRISPELDERLDPKKSTAAMAKHLLGLHSEFKSWPLAVLAYNLGGQRLRRLMQELGSQDPWVIEASGRFPRYLSRVWAVHALRSSPALIAQLR